MIVLSIAATALGAAADKANVSRAALDHAPSSAPQAVGDWPQLGHDAQRTNDTSVQVNPPYCYTWKWYEAPIATRAQPVVANGRLFVGSMDGVMYARNASTGASLWAINAGSPIRHSAGVMSDTVVFTTHAGYTLALDAATGSLKWKTLTGSGSTAPLMDGSLGRVYAASSDGTMSALNLSDGSRIWQYDSGGPILTSPSLSVDGQTIFAGNENIYAIAVNAANGSEIWRTRLQGQSLAERYPVVSGSAVIYRSQPLYFFHVLLQEGDQVMDQAGALSASWAADWANVRPRIIDYLTATPSKQTFFVLNASDGSSRGVAPVLYTYGGNDIPNMPVVRNTGTYVTYRARHGIQTDGGAVHVSSKYDAELGQMNLGTLDITGLTASEPLSGPQFRMTSDEPTMLSMGGDILWADNWERLGGINVSTGQLIHVGAVSNASPGCNELCGPGSSNPFFPLTGSGAAYPLPSPRVTEGFQRGGVVIANNMLYWRVIEGGLAGISHRAGSTCPTPLVYTQTLVSAQSTVPGTRPSLLTGRSPLSTSARPLGDYVTLDLTTPIANPPADLVDRLRREVRNLVSANDHLMPFYLERGFTQSYLWPYDTPNPPGPPSIIYGSHGNAYWHDPGELLYSMALAYPYLDASLQASVKQYMAKEMATYPPLQNLPYSDPARDWLHKGVPRESYDVPFRAQLNNWPPHAATMSTLYALWLWSKNTGDWSYAQAHWSEATALFNSRRTDMSDYYSDIAGAIGYARLAQHFSNANAFNTGLQAAVNAMQTGTNLTAFIDYARTHYLDPPDRATGWYLPVFYGMTPEVGLYLREQTNGQAQSHIASIEGGDGLRWWYLTRAGTHAEAGETSYVAPSAAWSHFLAHAYIVGDGQETLRKWLDRPWGRGDLYSIQKIVATIQASRLGPDLSATTKSASTPVPATGATITYTIAIRNDGGALADTVRLTDTLPVGLSYVAGSLAASSGTVDDSAVQTLRWSGTLSNTPDITLTYRAVVVETGVRSISNVAHVDAGSAGSLDRSGTIIANGLKFYLPTLLRNFVSP